MSEKYRLPDYEEATSAPPEYSPASIQYTATPASITNHASVSDTTVVLTSPYKVFHKGARFNEFAQPRIPPPPPGCQPNYFQQLQMDKGELKVVIADPKHQSGHQYDNLTFSDPDS